MRTATTRWALAIASCLVLTGCSNWISDTVGRLQGSDEIPAPVGIGPGQDELRRSPCACIPIPLERPST